ncbi:hypothetical protein BS50DRAFT_159573 [Corynespora cassiicola Philippines]|uniref:Uncharacterized protein n=1 Tax=Corynespora cassiicola Philippines TaxID=1448308 RepID=A0A2T2N6A1_CORCC|nr:hypothetical protein BS50DRAFT_159573 [Corynespora cassiicola Philippines]
MYVRLRMSTLNTHANVNIACTRSTSATPTRRGRTPERPESIYRWPPAPRPSSEERSRAHRLHRPPKHVAFCGLGYRAWGPAGWGRLGVGSRPCMLPMRFSSHGHLEWAPFPPVLMQHIRGWGETYSIDTGVSSAPRSNWPPLIGGIMAQLRMAHQLATRKVGGYRSPPSCPPATAM